MNKVRYNVLRIWSILLIGLLNVQRCSAAIPDAIYFRNIIAEIMLVSGTGTPLLGKVRVDGLRPATIKIDYNDIKNFPVKIVSIPDKINLGDINKEVLDRCLLAIANEPNLFERIDQRQNFKKDDMYLDVLRKTLNNASQFVPYDINNPAIFSDVNKPADLKASLCLADSRVYFWNALDDRDVLGWASIQGSQEWETTREPKLTVWVIPRLDKSTSFINSWNELATQTDINSRKSLLKLALDLDIKDTNGYLEQLMGSIETKTNRNHNVIIVTSGNVLQLEINLLSGDGIPRPGKFRIDGIWPGEGEVLKFMPILPFWPPKTEDNEKESPN